jgi:hypothetical protein
MSFKKWSEAQDAARKDPAVATDDNAAVAPAVAKPAAVPEKTPEGAPIQGPPANDA